MSNDQSQPARKVIPYKKGGRRQSPFAGKAFQFSGTALDIAIQQREQEELEEKSEISDDVGLPGESSQQASFATQVQPLQEINPTSDEPPSLTSDTSEELISQPPPPPQKLESVERRPAQRSTPVRTRSNNTVSAIATDSPELQAFITRWKPFLTDTQIGICSYVYNNSTAVGKEFCFTSTAKLMAEVSKTERQVKTVLNQLIEWHFLIKGETIINAPREKRGTHYKLNLDKS
ncbi:MAG: hypothetical protein LC803_24115 [Acidobacteria bacterium]|nr:hypothetical protein [Acidobacteriota bacterium]